MSASSRCHRGNVQGELGCYSLIREKEVIVSSSLLRKSNSKLKLEVDDCVKEEDANGGALIA
uniref:Uncharacterized protein n=1 Tax=Arundo donax TaxID=35708 RepID=A0A0A8YDW4_ARUDO